MTTSGLCQSVFKIFKISPSSKTRNYILPVPTREHKLVVVFFFMFRPRGHFNITAENLMAISSRFHPFMSPTYRPYEVVIRNLYHSTLISDISDALLELGHSTKRVMNAKKNGHQLPLFSRTLNSTPTIKIF